MRPPKNAWPSTSKAERTLFFAQCMRQFLDETAFEGFRAYALDTVARIRELSDLCGHVDSMGMKNDMLHPIIKELKWSLQADLAATSIIQQESDYFIKYIKEDGKPQEIRRVCNMLLRRLRERYRPVLIKNISDQVDEGGSKIELLKSTGFLVSSLLNDGFSRSYLAQCVERRFFENPVSRTGPAVVKKFLEDIEGDYREYNVIVCVNDVAASVVQYIGKRPVLKFNDLPAHAQGVIATWRDFDPNRRYINICAKAPDMFGAVKNAIDSLGELSILSVIPFRFVDIEWDKLFYVYPVRSNTGNTIVSKEAQRAAAGGAVSGWRLKNLSNIPKTIDAKFDSSSRERLKSAISTASIAIKSEIEEAQLISLWSSFEVLVGNPGFKEARITYFLSKLPSLICYKYHRSIMAAVYDELSVYYRRPFVSLVGSVNPGQDLHSQFIRIISVPDYVAERKALCDIVSSSPLALHRLWRIHDLFGTPQKCMRTIVDHRSRVEWQIQRIYRARNSLVHAGQIPIYTGTLVQNSLEYFRTAITNLCRRARSVDWECEIDELISEFDVSWQMQIVKLEASIKDGAFTDASADSIFGHL